MELGTLGQTEASIISMIAVFSLGIELVVCFCWVRWVPLGALGWLLLHRKIPWVISVPRCRCIRKYLCSCTCFCLCLSFPCPHLSSPPSHLCLSPSLQATITMVMAMAMAKITPPTMGMVWPLQTLGKCLALTQTQTLVLWVAPVLIPFCPELTSA